MIKRSKEEIEIDFYRALKEAQEIEEMAAELGTLANSGMKESLALLNRNFKGPSGEKAASIGEDVVMNLLMAADDMLSVAKNIRHTSKIIYNAEKIGLYATN